MLQEDTSLEHNINRSKEVEHLEASTMTTEQQVCEQHIIAHTPQQDDRGSVVRLPTKMDAKQLLLSSLSAERRMHIFERDWNKNSRFSTTISLGNPKN